MIQTEISQPVVSSVENPRSLVRFRRGLVRLSRMPVFCWVTLDFALSSFATWQTFMGNETEINKFGAFGIVSLSGLSACVVIIAGFITNLYSFESLRSWTRFLPKAILATTLALTGTLSMGYIVFYTVPGRWIALYGATAIFGAMLVSRLPFLLLRRYLRVRILLIGTRKEIEHVQQLLDSAGPHAYELASFMPVETLTNTDEDIHGVVSLCRMQSIDEVVLPSSGDQVTKCFSACLASIHSGCKVTLLPSLIEDESQQVPLDLVDSSWLLGNGWDIRNPLVETAKRLTDIFFGLLGLVLCLPLFFAVALVIMISARGPIFYTQVRIGRFGLPFRIYKFRTMRVDAEKNGAQWATTNDPRVTWYGAFLRKTRIDETPQFLNILLGHMSFVGPRPERPEFVEELSRKLPFYRVRHLVRPGLTGWAQICFQYGASVEDAKQKLQYDLHYIRNQSIFLDLSIVLRTFVAMMKGAR